MKKINLFWSFTLITLSVFISCPPLQAAETGERAEEGWFTIKNGALWKDDRGKTVQAHGAGFLQIGDTWYMIGEDRETAKWNPDVNMYSSKDFTHWKFEGKIIKNGAHSFKYPDGTTGTLGSNRMIERPKLLYCAKTGQYVIWCHWEAGNYGASEAAVFYSDQITGPYKLHWAGRPLNVKSRDCNVFQDDNGKAYFISTTNENRDLGLFELSDDYLSVVKHTPIFTGQGREAPAIVKVNGTYFMISSACTGWDPNQAKISYSKSLTSGWSSNQNIGNGISFDTQAASILTITGTEGTSYVYVGDRWMDPDLAESKTILFPISFSGNSCTFGYRSQFDLNLLTGKWNETNPSGRIPKSGWKIRAFSSQETSGENGAAANAIDGNPATKWHTRYSGSVAAAPHYIEVDMGAEYKVSGFLGTPRTDNSTNGLIREFLFEVSRDGTTWETVSGGGWMPYHAEIYFTPATARYFRMTALSGTYASIAELDVLQNTPAYTAQNILPYYKIGTGGWQQSILINALTPGSNLTFGPSISSATGTWAFNGPNNHKAATREYTLTGLTADDAGIYTSVFLNSYNQSSRKGYSISVKDYSSLEETPYEEEVVERKYYNIQGVKLQQPDANQVCIVKKIYRNGSVKMEKAIYSDSY